MLQPLINGRAYDWSSISVYLFGKKIYGITAINYEETSEQQLNKGAGLYPVSYAPGDKNYEASMTLSMFEVQKIQDSLSITGFSITDIPPFDIIVEYAPLGQRRVTDRLVGCRFTNNVRTANQGDPDTVAELNLSVAQIVWGRSEGLVTTPNI